MRSGPVSALGDLKHDRRTVERERTRRRRPRSVQPSCVSHKCKAKPAHTNAVWVVTTKTRQCVLQQRRGSFSSTIGKGIDAAECVMAAVCAWKQRPA